MRSLNADEEFEKLNQTMLDKFLERNPHFATYLGLHEPYDYLLPDGSTEGLLGNLRLMEEWVNRLKETVKYDELNEEHKIDWELIEKAYEHSKFSFYEQRMHELNPDASEEIGGLIFVMFIRDYAPLEKRVDAIAARMEKLPKFLREFRSRFENSRPVRLWTETAIEKTRNLQGFFQFILHATKGRISDKVYER